MPTLNINGNIRTNTAAGWAADSTVYSAKTILVTTDATYGATDQRKFKIADGTQTWSNLDYFPVSGYDDATSSIQTQLNGKQASGSYLTSANITQVITNGVTDKSPSEDAVFDALALKQNSLTNPVTGTGTTNEITYFTAASTVASLPVATYPSLTELSYVKGVTSAIQTQINAKRGVIMTFFSAAQINPGDGAVYYFGANPASTMATVAGIGDSIAPVSFTIKSIYGICIQGAGSNENVTFDVGVNGSYTNISSSVQLTATTVEVSVTGLSISVSAGDNLTIRMTCPTWVTTNPTNFRSSFNVYGD